MSSSSLSQELGKILWWIVRTSRDLLSEQTVCLCSGIHMPVALVWMQMQLSFAIFLAEATVWCQQGVHFPWSLSCGAPGTLESPLPGGHGD